MFRSQFPTHVHTDAAQAAGIGQIRELSASVSIGITRNAGEEPKEIANTPFAFRARVDGDVRSNLNAHLSKGEAYLSPVVQGMIAALAAREGKPDLISISSGFINEPDGRSHGLIFNGPGGELFRKSKVDPNVYHPATVEGKELKVHKAVAIRVDTQ